MKQPINGQQGEEEKTQTKHKYDIASLTKQMLKYHSKHNYVSKQIVVCLRELL